VANGVAGEAVLEGMWSSERSCLGGKMGSATLNEVTSVHIARSPTERVSELLQKNKDVSATRKPGRSAAGEEKKFHIRSTRRSCRSTTTRRYSTRKNE
jgi:hypothetical protein